MIHNVTEVKLLCDNRSYNDLTEADKVYAQIHEFIACTSTLMKVSLHFLFSDSYNKRAILNRWITSFFFFENFSSDH